MIQINGLLTACKFLLRHRIRIFDKMRFYPSATAGSLKHLRPTSIFPVQMDNNKIRHALRAHVKRRGITVNDWCRRAGIPARTVYAFLDGKTKDFGSARLIALADAERISVDQLIGRTSFDKQGLLEAVTPMVMRLGTRLSLEDVSRETGVPLPTLQIEWLCASDVIIDVYLHNAPELVAQHIADIDGENAADRICAIAANALDWIGNYPDFFLAFHSAVVTAAPGQREKFQTETSKVVNQLKRIALDQSKDLLVTDEREKIALSRVLLALFRSLSITYAQTKNSDEIMRQFREFVTVVLDHRVAK